MGKGKRERGKTKDERGKRKEESGKRKAERGKRKEEAGKSSTCHKTWFRFLAQRKPNARLEIYKAFQDGLTFLIRHMIVWIGCDS